MQAVRLSTRPMHCPKSSGAKASTLLMSSPPCGQTAQAQQATESDCTALASIGYRPWYGPVHLRVALQKHIPRHKVVWYSNHSVPRQYWKGDALRVLVFCMCSYSVPRLVGVSNP